MNARRTASCRTCCALRLAAVLAPMALLAGCSWFSFLPWVDAEEKKADPDEPAALVAFDAEARLERRWRAKVGRGLGAQVPAAASRGAGGSGVRCRRLRHRGGVEQIQRQAHLGGVGGRSGRRFLLPVLGSPRPGLRHRRRRRRRRSGSSWHDPWRSGGAGRRRRHGIVASRSVERSAVASRCRRRRGDRADRRWPSRRLGSRRRRSALDLRQPSAAADAARHGHAGGGERPGLRWFRRRQRGRHGRPQRRTDLAPAHHAATGAHRVGSHGGRGRHAAVRRRPAACGELPRTAEGTEPARPEAWCGTSKRRASSISPRATDRSTWSPKTM